MDLLKQMTQHLLQGEDEEVSRLVQEALDQHIPPAAVLNDGLIAGMAVVGQKFKEHELFLPDVLLAARAMYAGMELLRPLFTKGAMPNRGRVVLGTVQGDLHDIGKNLVAIMLKGAGFDVIDLGNDVSPERFVDTAVKEQAPVIGLSALLTTTMPVMKGVVDLIKQRGLSGKVRVVIGGAPVSEQYAREIGADGYGFDGVNAVECISRLVKGA
jgi:5-methyltetrahydrofolate--homocysteine methyltransferase